MYLVNFVFLCFVTVILLDNELIVRVINHLNFVLKIWPHSLSKNSKTIIQDTSIYYLFIIILDYYFYS